MEMVYQYLTGPRFRHRVEGIVEKFCDMQADLDKHIDANCLQAQGAGSLAPVASNRTEEDRAKNRRMELVEQ